MNQGLCVAKLIIQWLGCVFPPKILNKQKDNFRFLGNEDEPIQRKPNHQGHQGARRWPESRGHCS